MDEGEEGFVTPRQMGVSCLAAAAVCMACHGAGAGTPEAVGQPHASMASREPDRWQWALLVCSLPLSMS